MMKESAFKNSFENPDESFRPRPLFFWNGKPDAAGICGQLSAAKQSGYGGAGVLAYDACNTEYLGEEYFELYRALVESARENGLKVCIYDEWWFPSGWAGGLLKQRFPDSAARSLELTRDPLKLGKNALSAAPSGKLMSAVAFETETRERIKIDEFDPEAFEWNKDGKWELLRFTCVLSPWDHVNYLDPAAVAKFVEITHEAYYGRFSEYFGNTIDSSFYDEPQFYAVGGRMWTERFNEIFAGRKGFSPELLYPALWFDIGEETASARNELLGLRADLYAEGFPKVVQEWCSSKGIFLTGHVDQEEAVNPCGITGDLLKSFRYQDVPGVDEIAFPGRGSKIYKLVSSSAYNYGKQLVMVECFGAMPNLTEAQMYREANELYAKGINLFVPHAIWYDGAPDKVIFQPELSSKDEFYGPILPKFNRYCSRLSAMLQQGAHVSRVGVLYPIESLQAEYRFDWGGDPYLGGPAEPWMDYQELGETLFYGANCDFTFVHPERIESEGRVVCNAVPELNFGETLHDESYRAVILPGQTVMRLSVLKKLAEFYLLGGTIIAATRLPDRSAERGRDGELKSLLAEIFGSERIGSQVSVRTNENGGRAILLPEPNAELLNSLLGERRDVCFENRIDGLCCQHKKRGEGDVYFFWNRSENPVETEVSVTAGKNAFTHWLIPASGDTVCVSSESAEGGKLCFALSLAPGEAKFLTVEK